MIKKPIKISILILVARILSEYMYLDVMSEKIRWTKERLKKDIFAERILKWYRDNSRDFPWRRTDDPYEIMVSEMMLQRTRAANVVPVYRDFLKKYPTIRKLAKADVNEIENTIESLGLQKPRAERLKKIASTIVEEHSGKIPLIEGELLSLNGIGYYMAYAILCFTGTEDKAVVDWNVVRVTKRVWNYKMKSSPHTDRELMEFAQSILPMGKGKFYNWALLDFSALICKPGVPKCEICPVSDICNYINKK